MIRGFFLLLGVLLGLSLALIFEARISHIRTLAALANVTLPDWTSRLSGDTRLLEGQHLNASALLWPNAPPGAPEVHINWQFQAVTPEGLRFLVALSGAQIALRGDLLIRFSHRQALLSDLHGDLAVSHFLWASQAAQLPLTGLVQLDTVKTRIDYGERQLLSVSGKMALYPARFDGTELGAAIITLSQSGTKGWAARFDMPKGALQMTADLQGSFGDGTAEAEAVILENNEMPEGWERWFNQNLPRGSVGWKFNKNMELQDLILKY
ncbi:MAG: hypothetical protein KUG74_03580 [Rhodobacteraceae bacterium]|nr:hypothetical protein [Paracoccaceae bacterium]